MHKCTTFSAAGLFYRFSMCARTASIEKHCPTKLARVAHSNQLTVLCTRFFGKPNFISSQLLEHTNPYHTLLHCPSIPCLNTLVGIVLYLNTSLGCTLTHFIAEIFANLETLLTSTQIYDIDELYPILILLSIAPLFLCCSHKVIEEIGWSFIECEFFLFSQWCILKKLLICKIYCTTEFNP